jgi:cytoskeletal protein CcmA (bactofilin family)
MSAPSFSVFGADVSICGNVSATADLHVDGRVEGDIGCTGLVQGEASEILGAIVAETARLAGTVRGTVEARQLVILKTARIHGDVRYEALTVEQGAVVEGRFTRRGHGDAVPASEEDGILLLTS